MAVGVDWGDKIEGGGIVGWVDAGVEKVEGGNEGAEKFVRG